MIPFGHSVTLETSIDCLYIVPLKQENLVKMLLQRKHSATAVSKCCFRCWCQNMYAAVQGEQCSMEMWDGAKGPNYGRWAREGEKVG